MTVNKHFSPTMAMVSEMQMPVTSCDEFPTQLTMQMIVTTAMPMSIQTWKKSAMD